MVEHTTDTGGVLGSNPSARTKSREANFGARKDAPTRVRLGFEKSEHIPRHEHSEWLGMRRLYSSCKERILVRAPRLSLAKLGFARCKHLTSTRFARSVQAPYLDSLRFKGFFEIIRIYDNPLNMLK